MKKYCSGREFKKKPFSETKSKGISCFVPSAVRVGFLRKNSIHYTNFNYSRDTLKKFQIKNINS
ncbi:hypothetical protein AT05_05105 [Schleiferia thermophila str. Yellowstone]|nr:hypothetical protein AT05_05105 [Schleiferia thermophila str. Yellowstone]